MKNSPVDRQHRYNSDVLCDVATRQRMLIHVLNIKALNKEASQRTRDWNLEATTMVYADNSAAVCNERSVQTVHATLNIKSSEKAEKKLTPLHAAIVPLYMLCRSPLLYSQYSSKESSLGPSEFDIPNTSR